MPIYEVEAPNGQILEIEGDTQPSEQDLDNIFKNTNTQNIQPQEPIKAGAGVDITPSGMIKRTNALLDSAPIALPAIATGDFDTAKKIYNYNTDKLLRNRKPIQDDLTDLIGYTGLSFIPGLQPVGAAKNAALGAKVGNFLLNAARVGAIPGALEGLKNGIGSAGLGALGGSAIAGGIQATLPPLARGVGKGFQKIAENPNVQKGVAKTVEVLTSVPEKLVNKAIQSELAGQSLLKGKFNPETAYQGVERKLRTAKGTLPTKQQYQKQYKEIGDKVRQKLNKSTVNESVFDEQIAKLGQKATNGLEFLKTDAENKLMNVLGILDDKIAGTNNVKNAVDGIINQFGEGGVYNSAIEEAPQVVGYLDKELSKDGLTLRDLHRIKERLYALGYQADKLKEGTAAKVARGTAGQINNYLRSVAPEYIQPNETYATIVNLENELGGLNKNTIGGKLKNYGDSSQILSGFKDKLQRLDNILPDEMKFLDEVQNINSKRLAQEQLTSNLPESILNDISKYQNAPLEVQNTLERFAPDELNAFRNIYDKQTTQNDIMKTVAGQQYERNPRLLANRNDLKAEEALEYLQEQSGIKFMDELENLRAREALEKWFPGQGGGSGSEQGFGNLLRNSIIGGAPTAALLTHNPAAVLGLGLVSPKITGQGLIKGLGNLRNIGNKLMNADGFAGNVARRVLPAAFISMPPLQAGVTYNEYN